MSIIDITRLSRERDDRGKNHIRGILNCHMHGVNGCAGLSNITLEEFVVLLSRETQKSNDAAKHLMFNIVGALKEIERDVREFGLPYSNAANQTPEECSFGGIIALINDTLLNETVYPKANASSFFHLDNGIRGHTFDLAEKEGDEAFVPSEAAIDAFHRLLSKVTVNLQRKRESAEHELSRAKGGKS